MGTGKTGYGTGEGGPAQFDNLQITPTAGLPPASVGPIKSLSAGRHAPASSVYVTAVGYDIGGLSGNC
jgi:hypothetical protein